MDNQTNMCKALGFFDPFPASGWNPGQGENWPRVCTLSFCYKFGYVYIWYTHVFIDLFICLFIYLQASQKDMQDI